MPELPPDEPLPRVLPDMRPRFLRGFRRRLLNFVVTSVVLPAVLLALAGALVWRFQPNGPPVPNGPPMPTPTETTTRPTPTQVQVPDVAGLSEDDATRLLRRHNLMVGETTNRRSDRPKGTVIGSEPGARTTVDAGTKVDLFISRGSQPSPTCPVTLPDLTGLPVDEATRGLGDQGLNVRVAEVDVPGAEPGRVVRQDPQPDTQVDCGRTVTLFVSREPTPSLT